jgi:hypothetical protein
VPWLAVAIQILVPIIFFLPARASEAPSVASRPRQA